MPERRLVDRLGEDPVGELQDDVRPLGVGQECARREQPALRMLPPDQGLGPMYATAVRIVQRLVVQAQVPGPDPGTQLGELPQIRALAGVGKRVTTY